MAHAELRKHARAPLQGLVRCTTPTGEQIMASGGNISCGGLFVPTGKAPELGARLHVQFRLPYPGHSLLGQARVIWRRAPEQSPGPAGVGLAFDTLSERDRAAIARYVERTAGAP